MQFRPVAALVVLGLVVAAVSPALAADKAQDLIVGKWEPTTNTEKVTLEFLKDGKIKITAGESLSFDGAYKFIDEKTMEVKVTFGGDEKTTKMTVTVTKDELTTQEVGKDKKSTFKRVK